MQQVEAEFAPELASARGARGLVDAALRGVGVPADLAILLVSELATNAVMHARTDFVVRVLGTPVAGRVRIEVEDGNERPPSIAHTPPEATSGRGLQLVQTLADAWGVDASPSGKVVWFELSTPDPDTAHASNGATRPRQRAFAS